ncbi:hypothetical protein [Campylobacter magnus]|uniref:Uncharacterized protein n=1 Tax=Campylobacter magnus TaxID=3026462 RepID=A0ABT8T7Y7_9BACT|nr:hypothetical protein [Campylobacter magnus]MDO2409390.1 hypothetical protein [Campylobacter magnus]
MLKFLNAIISSFKAFFGKRIDDKKLLKSIMSVLVMRGLRSKEGLGKMEF